MLSLAEMQAFENYVNTRENVIGIGFKPSDLRGIGTEYLVVNGNVIAKFYDGNLVCEAVVISSNEKTLLPVVEADNVK